MTLACPQCKSPVAREGQRFCYRCGNDLREYYEALNIQQPDSEPAQPALASNPGEMAITGQTRVKETDNIPRASDTVAVDPITTTDSIRPGEEVEPKALLRILLPSGDVFDREMQKAEAQIGKGPRNDIVIADPAVSSSHALIRVEESGYLIVDLGSRNGTFVNSERISQPQKLNHGDVIGIGLSKITFRLRDHSETGAINLTEVLGQQPISQGPLPLTEDSLAQEIINEGLVTRNDVERLRGADSRGRRLYRALLDERQMSEESLRDLMSRIFQLPTVELSSTEIDEASAIRFSSRIARDHHVFAFKEADSRLQLAICDPTDTAAVEKVEKEMGMPVDLHLDTWTRISEQIEAFYGPKLIGVLPSGEKLRYMINQPEVEIGKASHNNIVIADPTVSNTHAILMVRDGGYSIVDLGSRNGTFVNGERLGAHAHTLRHGDSVQLGQTVLTFRNSGETTENVTATLSAEALEEIRRKAGMETATPAPPRPDTDPGERKKIPTSETPAPTPAQPPQPPQPEIAVAPVAALATPPPVEEHPDEKKKKKKKKEDDRLRAAYVGAASRIVAQVLAVLLTVGLSLYIVNRSMSPSQPATDNTNGKPKRERVATPGAGIPFAGGVFEASGVAQIPNTDGVYFVDDAKPGQIFWMQLDQSGRQVGDIKLIDYGYPVADHEGIVYGGSFFYVVGSNSQPEKAERNALARFAFDAATQTVNGPPEVITDLRGFLLENVPELRDVKDKPGNAGGLNIEGIAWDVTNDRLLLGLRSPVVNGQSLVVPIKLRDPRGAFSRDNLQPPGAAMPLSLGGLGIRDIYYDNRSNSYLIIAGSPVSTGLGGSSVSSLWEWNGDTNQTSQDPNPRELTKLDPVMKPEGVTRVRMGGRDYILIVGDGSSYMKVDITEPQ